MIIEKKLSRKLGSLEPVIYFENSKGDIVLPPDSETAYYFYWHKKDQRGKTYRDWGFEWREAGTLEEVDRLQKKLNAAERRKLEEAGERDERLYKLRTQETHDRLRARMVSSSTSPYEREFIDLWLKLQDEKRRAHHKQRFEERASYLWAREMDQGTLPQDRILS